MKKGVVIHDNICEHLNFTIISGDLICSKCGQVLQSNSQLSFDSVSSNRGTTPSAVPTSANIPISVQFQSHQEREEWALRALARKLITSFALKPSYDPEALNLIHQYWDQHNSKQKYGLCGNRLLVAVMFLLARRDHLAINLSLLASSIGSNSQECGVYLDSLTKIDPSLQALARVSDYIERSVELLISNLELIHGYKLIEDQLIRLKRLSISLGDFIQPIESGSSKSAEATALAASSLALGSLLLHDSIQLNLETSVLPKICESSNVSLKSVKLKRSALIEKLIERADQLIPSMFSIKMTRARKLELVLINLNVLLCNT